MPAKNPKPRNRRYGGKRKPSLSEVEGVLSERFTAANPLRIARLARNLSQEDLSRLSGITRVTITRIEIGRSAGRPDTFRALEAALGVPSGVLEKQFRRWRDEFNPIDFMSANARAWLALPPEGVPAKFASWVNWRQNVAGSTGYMARLLQISEEVVREFEAGHSPRGQMPRALIVGLSQRFGLSAEYIRELILLPVRSQKPPPFIPKDKRPPLNPPGDYPWLR